VRHNLQYHMLSKNSYSIEEVVWRSTSTFSVVANYKQVKSNLAVL